MEVGEMTNTVLLDSIVVEHSKSSGFEVTSYKMGGEPHAAAIVAAVFASYNEVAARPEPTEDELRDLAGKPLTILQSSSNMFGAGSITARQGKVFLASGERLAWLPKGKTRNGFRLDPTTVMDVEVGYNREQQLRERVDAVRSTFPVLEPLTQERLNALPDRGEECTLTLFGTLPFIDGPIPGCVWLIHSYMAEDDILEGVLLVPPSIATSEHGSVYGQQLLGRCGVVTDALTLTLADAMALTDSEIESVYATIAGRDGKR